MKGHRKHFAAFALLLFGWIAYGTFGGWLAERLAQRFGAAVVAAFQGKFSNPTVFMHHRLFEMLWLLTLVQLWITVHTVLAAQLKQRPAWSRWHWVVQGTTGFICLNLWIAAACGTVIFWSALGAGLGIQNQLQFEIKRLLLQEDPAPHRAVLLGSSQSRAQIDERQLNNLAGTHFWTYELHYPGSHAFDVWLAEQRLSRANPEWVICYFNEAYLYTGSYSETAPAFLKFQDLPELMRLRAAKHVPTAAIASGLFGNLLPLFRCREVFAQRLLGEVSANMKQRSYDASLQVDLEKRAAEMASRFQMDAGSEFQKQAFEEFVMGCQQANRRVILLRGGFNPLLDRKIPQEMRADLEAFLKQLQQRYSSVTVVSEKELPQQLPSDYDDL